jgi:hypothetical protein
LGCALWSRSSPQPSFTPQPSFSQFSSEQAVLLYLPLRACTREPTDFVCRCGCLCISSVHSLCSAACITRGPGQGRVRIGAGIQLVSPLHLQEAVTTSSQRAKLRWSVLQMPRISRHSCSHTLQQENRIVLRRRSRSHESSS